VTCVLGPFITVACAATVVAVTTACRPTPLLVWNASELSVPSRLFPAVHAPMFLSPPHADLFVERHPDRARVSLQLASSALRGLDGLIWPKDRLRLDRLSATTPQDFLSLSGKSPRDRSSQR
jgi:hypothetical protein